ncbi:hypothetical protein I6N90_17145 [Paenibacillus sp. GSMTC-2017]|uniref:hypothetical protein n=1 Tax=Paenibacillus sp. GSMTC-2017 TaxID=2794350 RepID=UPI0018D62ABF|nr:hypothetical protein [Paenibacillus sp. GSMTC-2017]MBH5319525.1 hypothetical protein [Paenibacillus sp. GSMTC-2017]
MRKKVRIMFIFTIFVLCFEFLNPISQAASKDASGIEWSTLTATESNDLNDIAMDDESNYVVVGSDQTILHSKDGKQWTNVKSPTIGDLNSIVSNGKNFVTVGEKGSLLSSKDGISWSAGKLINPPTQKDMYKYYKTTHPKEYPLVKWGQKVNKEDLNFFNVVWDGKRYISVGIWRIYSRPDRALSHTQGIISTSVNGIDWTVVPLKYDLKKLNVSFEIDPVPGKIAYNGTKYVIKAGPLTLSSSNLVTWDARLPSNGYTIQDIINRDKQFIAISSDPKTEKPALYTSTDGLTWKIVKSNISTTDIDILNLVWDGNQFIGLQAFNSTIHSTDLITWKTKGNYYTNDITTHGFEKILDDSMINAIFHDGTKQIAITNYGTILINEVDNSDSPTATYWTVVREKTQLDFTHLLFDGKNRYVATGHYNIPFVYDDIGSLWESSNGYDWSRSEIKSLPSYIDWSKLVAGKGTILAFGSGTDRFGYPIMGIQSYYSTAPGVWTKSKFPSSVTTIDSVSWLNNQFYAVVNGGYTTSKDGITWSKVKTSPVITSKVVKGGNIYLALGQSKNQTDNMGNIYRSTDGVTWKNVDLTLNNDYWLSSQRASDILWNGKQFSILSNNSTVATSANGLKWKQKPTNIRLLNSVWSGKLYVASSISDWGGGGIMHYSYDGLNYTKSAQVTVNSLNTDVIWDGKKFIVAGDNGTMLIGTPTK